MKATCPACGTEFNAKLHAKGAGYALKWHALPDRCKELLAWWVSSEYVYDRLTKDQIEAKYNHTTISGLQARVSELYALDLLIRHAKAKPTYPTITYSLNIAKVTKVLNNYGQLK